MNEDPDRGEFDEILIRRFDELSASRGPCPAPLRLVRFAQRDLPTEEARETDRHIAGCGLCDAAIFRLRRASKIKFWRGIFGSLIAILIAFGVGLTLRSNRKSGGFDPSGPLALDSVQVLSLDVIRRPQAEESREPAAPFIALSFFLPIEANARCTITLRDSRDTILLSQTGVRSYDGKGNFLLLLSRAKLKPAAYRLITEDAAGTKTQFDFTL